MGRSVSTTTYLLTDKKVESGKIIYVVPVGIGEVTLTADVEEQLVEDVLLGKIS